jgi:hypothetical protein
MGTLPPERDIRSASSPSVVSRRTPSERKSSGATTCQPIARSITKRAMVGRPACAPAGVVSVERQLRGLSSAR